MELIYINRKNKIETLKGVYDVGNKEHTFTFDEENFIISLVKDGKRGTSSQIELLEQFYCSLTNSKICLDGRYFSEQSRVLVIHDDFFFFN